MKKRYRLLLSLAVICVIASLIVSSVFYNRYTEYKKMNNQTYENLMSSVYSYGLEIPATKIDAIVQLIKLNSPEAREGIETWILEIASDYSVAQNAAALLEPFISDDEGNPGSPVQMYRFFGDLKSLLLDMVRTEDDLEQWKQIGLELSDIMTSLKTNLDKQKLADASDAAQQWNEAIHQLKQRYSDTYILQHIIR
ncbi:hypothetical protein [Paenibacillus kobensis]|uniref:hypothetical protein n=1 Tax=Paenibacillus kobensis TaxID=59841 RepID=UPI000FDA3839|nr:hypothetical protein [Paenibacillus kobensis]